MPVVIKSILPVDYVLSCISKYRTNPKLVSSTDTLRTNPKFVSSTDETTVPLKCTFFFSMDMYGALIYLW